MEDLNIRIPKDPKVMIALANYLWDSAEAIDPSVTDEAVDKHLESLQAATPATATEQTPPPPPPATTEQAATPPPPTTVDVDSEGLPWDARIHSSGKTKLKKDNTWKLKKGIPEQEVVAVKEELRAAMGVTTEQTPPPPPATEQTPPPPPATDSEQAATPPPPPPPATATTVTFAEVMPKITAAGVTQEQIMAASAAFGLNNLLELSQKPELIPQVLTALGIT